MYIHLSDITSSFFVRLPFTLFVWAPDADQVKPGLRLLGVAPNNKGHPFRQGTQKRTANYLLENNVAVLIQNSLRAPLFI